MTDSSLRIAHLTDLHVNEKGDIAEQARVLKGIADRAVELGVQATLLTGDLYGKTVPHRSTPRERAVLYPWVARLAKLGPVVVTPGNHDYPGDLDTLAQIGGGMGWPVVVATRPGVIDLRTSGAPLRVYALPWPTGRVLLGKDDAPSGPEAIRQAASAHLDKLLQLWSHRIRHARQAEPGVVHAFAAHCMVNGGRTSGGEVLSGREIEISRHVLDRLGVDYGALGHLHFAQEVASRIWYGGDPYPVDFGETEEKTWNLVDVGDIASTPDRWPRHSSPLLSPYDAHTKQHTLSVHRLPTGHRRWLTLDWEWDPSYVAIPGSDIPVAQAWATEPTAEQLALVKGANVRARLRVSSEWRRSCPWDRVLADLRAAGAHSIKPVIDTIPVHRVRAPKVAAATTDADKCSAFWATLKPPPGATDQTNALQLLAELRTNTDDQISAATAALMPRVDR